MYEIFEQLLQKNGATPYKVSKATGISQTTFSSWKQGKLTPKIDKMQKIADYFGVSVDYLMGNEVEENKKNYYYLDEEARDVLREIKINDKLRVLVDATKKLEPSDIEFIINMAKKLKKDNK